MEKHRQVKILSIIALVLAVIGMTLGFAAFSTTLNISSSASVSPNSDDFKVRIIGLNGDNYMILDELKTNVSGNVPALIGDDGLTINGMVAKMSKPGDVVKWYGVLENIGKYDAYFSGKNINKFPDTGTWKKCTPTEKNGISQEYLEEVCEGISFNYGIYEYDPITNIVVSTDSLILGSLIDRNKKYILSFTIKYSEDAIYPDGDFEVLIGDASLEFSTVY